MVDTLIPDARFEKPSLLQKGRKPIGNVKVDFTNKLTDGLILCVLNNVNYINGFRVDKNGSEVIREDIVHDSTVDVVYLEESVDRLIPTKEISIALGYKKTDGTLRASGAVGIEYHAGYIPTACSILLPYSNGVVYWDFGGEVNGRGSKTGLTFGDDNWVFSSSFSKNNIYITQNGVDVGATTGTALTRTRSTIYKFSLGRAGVVSSDLAEYKYIYIYDRQISLDEASLLNDDPYQIFIPS